MELEFDRHGEPRTIKVIALDCFRIAILPLKLKPKRTCGTVIKCCRYPEPAGEMVGKFQTCVSAHIRYTRQVGIFGHLRGHRQVELPRITEMEALEQLFQNRRFFRLLTVRLLLLMMLLSSLLLTIV